MLRSAVKGEAWSDSWWPSGGSRVQRVWIKAAAAGKQSEDKLLLSKCKHALCTKCERHRNEFLSNVSFEGTDVGTLTDSCAVSILSLF